MSAISFQPACTRFQAQRPRFSAQPADIPSDPVEQFYLLLRLAGVNDEWMTQELGYRLIDVNPNFKGNRFISVELNREPAHMEDAGWSDELAAGIKRKMMEGLALNDADFDAQVGPLKVFIRGNGCCGRGCPACVDFHQPRGEYWRQPEQQLPQVDKQALIQALPELTP